MSVVNFDPQVEMDRIFYGCRIFYPFLTFIFILNYFLLKSHYRISNWFTMGWQCVEAKKTWCRDFDRELFINDLKIGVFDDIFWTPNSKDPPPLQTYWRGLLTFCKWENVLLGIPQLLYKFFDHICKTFS